MSASIRLELSHDLMTSIVEVEEGAFAGLVLKRVSIYQGIGNPSRQCVRLYLKLPRDIAAAYRLMRLCRQVSPSVFRAGIYNQSQTLLVNLRECMGLCGIGDAMEQGFLVDIREEPGELASWMAYADWLSEQSGAIDQAQAAIIAGWLGRKPVKTRNGIPEQVYNLRRAKGGKEVR